MSTKSSLLDLILSPISSVLRYATSEHGGSTQLSQQTGMANVI